MSALLLLLLVLAAVAWLALAARVMLVGARMLQIEEYEPARFLRWGLTPAWVMHRSCIAGGLLAAAGLVAAYVAPTQGVRVIAAGWLAGSAAASALWSWPAAKKALVLTARMRRLLAVAALLAMLCAAAAALLLATGHRTVGGALVIALLALAPPGAQALLVVAEWLLIPAEAVVRRRYLRAAATRLAGISPYVVAVAGSYGKTSTKHILAALLQPSIDTLATRKSFNTLMGVTRVINEDLQPSHRLFVVEMDAYAPGEIAAMCALVHPSIAVVTSVGPQHLERFRTMDRIAAALYEVVAALPPDGVAVMHGGDPSMRTLIERAAAEGREVVRYALQSTESAETADVLASDVHLDGSGARFRWTWPARGLARDVEIPLLGEHQVLNVTAALAVVVRAGHGLDAAVAAARTLPHIEHRLQPMPGAGAVTVIDDSYNANPVGVHNGLDVLARMDAGGRILVTPGLVELGSVEEAENRRYGEHAAAVCSDVIVMDARPAAALRAGLRAGGLADEHIHVARSLDEATAIIGRLSKPGDVVLFANDLPDTYLRAS